MIAQIRANPIAAINKFFVKGGAWLHHDLTEYQCNVIRRLEAGTERNYEILPRGHCKTVLVTRIWATMQVAFGLKKYVLAFAYGAANYRSNQDAVFNILTGPQFRGIQWLMPYFHGLEQPKRKDNMIVFGSGAKIEFVSILGNTRGTNDAGAAGRPDLIMLDDIIPTEAAWSEVYRQRVEDRYLSVIVPMGGKDCRIVGAGTTVHREDLVSKIAMGKMGGWTTTPIEDRAAIRRDGTLLFPERYTKEGLERIRINEYEALGKGHLYRREYFNDVAEPATHPFIGHSITVDIVDPNQCFRVIAIDHSQGLGKDYFVAGEIGRDYEGRTHVIDLERSNTIKVADRCELISRWIKRRQPHVLVVEDTSESRTFIDVLELYLIEDGLHVNFQQPTAASRGNKNDFIEGWVTPITKKGFLCCNLSDKSAIIQTEMDNFSTDSKTNVDDCLDMIANACKQMKTPKRPSTQDVGREMVQSAIIKKMKRAMR